MNTAMSSRSSYCNVSVWFMSALPNTRSGCNDRIVSFEGDKIDPTLGLFFASAGIFGVVSHRNHIRSSSQRIHIVHNTRHQTDQPVRMLGNLDCAPQLIYHRPCTAWVKCNAEDKPYAKSLHTYTSTERARNAAVTSEVAIAGFPRK
jgi:hypothetical protein